MAEISGILKYFQVVKKTEQSTLSDEAKLLVPNGSLSKVIPLPAIAAANKRSVLLIMPKRLQPEGHIYI